MDYLFWTSVVGTIAFAISGAAVAVRKKMDIFGVNILALTTAVGGGAIRDIIIGDTPPVMFRDPIYAILAIISANVVFIALSLNFYRLSYKIVYAYEVVLFISDTLGLAAFTVNGVYIGLNSSHPTEFLAIFLGVLTGVGGGILRDVMAQEMPAIFVRQVYAVASLAGAIIMVVLMKFTDSGLAMFVSFLVIIALRFLAARFKWNLPRINLEKKYMRPDYKEKENK